MDDTKTVYKEYRDRNEAIADIRTMREAGIENISTAELPPRVRPPSDVGAPPRHRGRRYTAIGGMIGACAGFIMGIAVFWLPAVLLNFQHSTVIGVAGTIVATIFGTLLGVAESFAQAKRKTYEPSSGKGERLLGVEVRPDNGRERKLASQTMNPRPV